MIEIDVNKLMGKSIAFVDDVLVLAGFEVLETYEIKNGDTLELYYKDDVTISFICCKGETHICRNFYLHA